MIDRNACVAVVGASGLVGREALAILAERGHPLDRVVALGSARSAGSTVPYGEGEASIHRLGAGSFAGVDLALFCADASVAREFAPAAIGAGATVIDNSSAFRMDPGVPLIIPEVNGHLIDSAPRPRLIANPNCSTIIMLTALEPIRRAFGIRSVVVSTYQAISGAGAAGLEELWEQTRAIASGAALASGVFPEPCAMNVFTHESEMDEVTGINGEERKMIDESRKIWADASLPIVPTCVRVPVERAHSQSITVELAAPAARDEIEEVLGAGPGVEFWAAAGPRHPTPRSASGGDRVLVGRVRRDPSGEGRRYSLWVCGDQLRKGAALNAVEIGGRVSARLNDLSGGRDTLESLINR